MTNPDLEYLTTSGRVNAPSPPSGRTPLDELTVAEFGSAFVEGYSTTCPEKSDSSCTYRHRGLEDLQDYSLAMLAVYPECEACGCMLEVVEDHDE